MAQQWPPRGYKLEDAPRGARGHAQGVPCKNVCNGKIKQGNKWRAQQQGPGQADGAHDLVPPGRPGQAWTPAAAHLPPESAVSKILVIHPPEVRASHP